MTTRRGILLAGGTGTRLFPVTLAVSKQLLPVYDKPMVFYPLTTLMSAGIRDIAIITTPHDQPAFQRLLGDGSRWGLSLTWLLQPRPEGLPQAYLVAEHFLDGRPSTMVLGDNLFFGQGLAACLRQDRPEGATVFVHRVTDPERYGVVDFDRSGRVRRLVEKPAIAPGPWVLTGLYHLDGTAPERARSLRPSARGELEITDLLSTWLPSGLGVQRLGSGFAWLDTGTHDSLLDASNFVRTLALRQGLHLGSPDVMAWENGWIDREEVLRSAHSYGDSAYSRALVARVEAGASPTDQEDSSET